MNVSKTLKGLLYSNNTNMESITEYLNINDNDIVKYKWNSTIHFPCYFLALDHKQSNIILSVRGTMSFYDIYTDLNNFKSPLFYCDNGKVHNGMKKSACNIYNDMLHYLIVTIDKYPDYNIKFVGHSLGAGTICIITHMFLTSYPHYRSKLQSYCFGSPPVMSFHLADQYKDVITSIVNENDIIPRLSVGYQLYLSGLILHATVINNKIKLIPRNKSYFIDKGIKKKMYKMHFPEEYLKVTKSF
jgi:predicted lipase